MHAYGMTRSMNLVYPDCADLAFLALKSATGHLRRHGGDYHSNVRSSSQKRQIRRQHKRVARRQGKAQASSFDD